MQVDAVDMAKVSTDAFLKNRLEIIAVNKKELADGLLKVQVTARNVRTGFWDQASSWYMGIILIKLPIVLPGWILMVWK